MGIRHDEKVDRLTEAKARVLGAGRRARDGVFFIAIADLGRLVSLRWETIR